MAAIISFSAHAGTNVGGGGSEVEGTVFELYLRKNQKTPKELGLEGKEELAEIRNLAPGLANEMSTILQKKWILVDEGKIKQLSQHETGIPLPAKQVIFQDSTTVYVDKEWLARATEEEKSVMLVHEFWQNVRLAKNETPTKDDEKIPPGNVHKITFDLLSSRPFTSGQLIALGEKYKFGTYLNKAQHEAHMKKLKAEEKFRQDTAAEEKKIIDHFVNEVRLACSASKGRTLVKKLENLTGAVYDESRNFGELKTPLQEARSNILRKFETVLFSIYEMNSLAYGVYTESRAGKTKYVKEILDRQEAQNLKGAIATAKKLCDRHALKPEVPEDDSSTSENETEKNEIRGE